jgi:16S rRNA processing protein RimM
MPGEGNSVSFRGDGGSGPHTGSEPHFLVIGRIASAVGLRGAVKALVMTDFPDRFGLLETVYLGDELTPHRISSYQLRKEGRQVVLRFQECQNRDQAELLRGKFIWIPTEQAMPLPEGQYYVHQLLGLEVETEEGEHLGVLREVLFPGGNDVYVIGDEKQEVLVPALRDVILQVDLAERRMVVRVPEGLRD